MSDVNAFIVASRFGGWTRSNTSPRRLPFLPFTSYLPACKPKCPPHFSIAIAVCVPRRGSPRTHRIIPAHPMSASAVDAGMWLGRVRQRGVWLVSATAAVRANRDVVMAAVQQSGRTLRYAAAALQGDREVVTAAVQQDASALQHAAESLKADRELVMAAVKQDGYALAHAAASLKADREVVMAAVQESGSALAYAAESLKGDREVVMAAVKQDGYSLQHATSALQDDGDLQAAAVELGFALANADDSIRADRSFILAGCQRYGTELEYVAESLKADQEVVMAAVKQDGSALQHAAESLKADREVVMAAVQQAGAALAHAAESLTADREVVMAAMQQDVDAFDYAAESLQADREVVMAAVQQNGDALEHAAESLKADREVVMAAVQQAGAALAHAAESLTADREVVMAAVQENGYALEHAAESLTADREVVMAAVQQDSSALEHAAESLQADREVVTAAIGNDLSALQYADTTLASDAPLIENATRVALGRQPLWSLARLRAFCDILDAGGHSARAGMHAAGLPNALLQAMGEGSVDVTLSSQLLQDLLGKHFVPRERGLVREAMAALDNDDAFAATPTAELVQLLQLAYADDNHRFAKLAAKALNRRTNEKASIAAWPLLLHYLLQLDNYSVDLTRLLASTALPVPHPSEFPTSAFVHLLMHTPFDFYNANARRVTATIDVQSLSTARIALESPWHNVPSSSEPLIAFRVVLRRAQAARHLAVIDTCQTSSANGANGVIASIRVATTILPPEAEASEPKEKTLTKRDSVCLSAHAMKSVSVRCKLPTDRALKVTGIVELVAHQKQWQLLAMYHTAWLRHKDPDAVKPDAIATLLFAFTEVASHHGMSAECVTLCKTVALRYTAHHFSLLAAQPAFCALPVAIVGNLLHMDELSTESEELTLLALTPWLQAPGRTGADVASALGGLRWAWLPLEVVLRLRQPGGVLHHVAADDDVREMVDGAVALICSNRKRPLQDDTLTCPITCVLRRCPFQLATGPPRQ